MTFVPACANTTPTSVRMNSNGSKSPADSHAIAAPSRVGTTAAVKKGALSSANQILSFEGFGSVILSVLHCGMVDIKHAHLAPLDCTRRAHTGSWLCFEPATIRIK